MGVDGINKEPHNEGEDLENSENSSRRRGDSDGSNVTPHEDAWVKSATQGSASSSSSEDVGDTPKYKTNGKSAEANGPIELGVMETNGSLAAPPSSRGVDLELLSRPSWCDATFALTQVKKVSSVVRISILLS